MANDEFLSSMTSDFRIQFLFQYKKSLKQNRVKRCPQAEYCTLFPMVPTLSSVEHERNFLWTQKGLWRVFVTKRNKGPIPWGSQQPTSLCGNTCGTFWITIKAPFFRFSSSDTNVLVLTLLLCNKGSEVRKDYNHILYELSSFTKTVPSLEARKNIVITNRIARNWI